MALLSEPAMAERPGARETAAALLSVVVPFYNEGPGVEAFFVRLIPVLEASRLAWEVVCVNDGSLDDTLDRLVAARARHPRIKVVDFSRNFGKELALSAGLAHARGDLVVAIDADLQHPPEVIPDMLAKWRQGYEVVYAVRATRDYQSRRARLMSRAFYWIFERLSDVALPEGAGDFRLLDRRVVDVINRMPERTRFMKGIFAWVGFRQIGIPFSPEARREGESKWDFVRLLRFAFDGLTAFSNFPLKVWGLIGATISLLAFIYIVVRLLRTAIYGIDVPGYESIIVTILFLGGMQLLTLGIIGDYLGRVFDEVKGRPLYVVRASYGFEPVGQGASAGERMPREAAAVERIEVSS
ncbi:MAG: glycosyltransferase family 2 protein [Alphaproteobacteria bacterium]